METTSLVAETLIIGLQTTLWILLIVAYTVGVPHIDEHLLKGWEAVIALYVVAVAYTLGIMFDRLAAAVLRSSENKLWHHLIAARRSWIRASADQALTEVDEMRLQIRQADDGAAAEADDLRRPLRITRATGVNLLIVATLLIVSKVLGWQQVISPEFTKALTVFSVLLLVIAVAAYFTLEVQYYRRIVIAHRVVCSAQSKPPR